MLIPVLGDQLSLSLSSLKRGDPARDVVLMAEVWDETQYVRHHKKKIAMIFSAMRHFAGELRGRGWTVDYVKLDDAGNTGSLSGEIARAMRRHGIPDAAMTEPAEWRLRSEFAAMKGEVQLIDDDRFICSHGTFARWAEGRKELRMEFFYREMRRAAGLLMDGKEPEGGQWNFDAENRKPAKPDLFMPQPPRFLPDGITRDVLDLVGARFAKHFGDLEPFWFPVTRGDAETARDHFMRECLPHFGDYQDAMLSGSKFLYHSVLSPVLNIGLLDPLDLCRRAETEYREGHAPLNAAEGFIRQILGWREFVRGIYWLKMPEYIERNGLDARRPLPDFYWTGETKMNCIAHAVRQTREEAYAHHIQRLMLTGNFALLAGLDPKAVHEWYLIVYADAFEWVELPNTLGMALHADGGLLGSKPYAASGNYINKMSDYCGTCAYDVKKRTGEGACPFNSLYWDFVARHHGRFRKNPRMAQICRTWEKFAPAEQARIRESAATFLAGLKPSPDWP
jgi:deoxyribodipyrimidine photolyase-related protein